MSWLYVPGMAASNWGSRWYAGTVLALSCTWKGKHRRYQFWSSTWRRAEWLQRLSGVTCPPSMLAHGVGSWISSQRATRASLSPSQDSEGSTEIAAGCGRTSPGSSPSASQRSYSLRTSQPTLPGLSSACSVTLPRSGSMRSGVVRARERLARPTNASVFSGSLPTPTASDSKASGSAGYSTESGRHPGTTLWDAVIRGHRKLPTPTASAATRGRAVRGANAQGGPSLGEVVGPGRRLNPRFVEWMMGLPEGWLRLRS